MATKSASKSNKAEVQFVRDHCVHKLCQAGWDKEKAEDMVALVSDAEICSMMPEQKMGALGDGKFLNWLKEKGPKLLETVTKIISLLSLFAEKPATDEGEATETEEETEE